MQRCQRFKLCEVVQDGLGHPDRSGTIESAMDEGFGGCGAKFSTCVFFNSAIRAVARSTWKSRSSSSLFLCAGVVDGVVKLLRLGEVRALRSLRRLELAVDAAVALFEPCGIPGQIEMDEVVAAHLQVDALARRVGANQDAKRVLGWVRIETALEFLAADDRQSPL